MTTRAVSPRPRDGVAASDDRGAATADRLRSDANYRRLNDRTKADIDRAFDRAADDAQREALASLAGADGFRMLNRDHQRQMVNVLGSAADQRSTASTLTTMANDDAFRSLADATKSKRIDEVIAGANLADLQADANYRRLDDRTKQDVVDSFQQAGGQAARDGVASLARADGYHQLSRDHQRQMLDVMNGAADPRGAASTLASMADDRAFRGLDDAVKTERIAAVAAPSPSSAAPSTSTPTVSTMPSATWSSITPSAPWSPSPTAPPTSAAPHASSGPVDAAPSLEPAAWQPLVTPREAAEAVRTGDYERLEGYYSPENGFPEPPTFVFDFDNTIKMDDLSHAEFASDAISLAESMGANVAIASASRMPGYLRGYLQDLNPEVFTDEMLRSDAFNAGEGRNKTPMLNDIFDHFEGSADNAVFFDDSSDNQQYADEVGVEMIELDRDRGITREDFIAGMNAIAPEHTTSTPRQSDSEPLRRPQPATADSALHQPSAPYVGLPEETSTVNWVQDQDAHQVTVGALNGAEISGMFSQRNGDAVESLAIEDTGDALFRVTQPIDAATGQIRGEDASVDRFRMTHGGRGLPTDRHGWGSQLEGFTQSPDGRFHAGQIGYRRPTGGSLDVYSGELASAQGSDVPTQRTRYELPDDHGAGDDFEAMSWGRYRDPDTGEVTDRMYFLSKQEGETNLFSGPPPVAGEDHTFALRHHDDLSLEHLVPSGSKLTDMQWGEDGLYYQVDQEKAGDGFAKGEHSSWMIPWGDHEVGDIAGALADGAPVRIEHTGGRSEALSPVHGWNDGRAAAPVDGAAPTAPAGVPPRQRVRSTVWDADTHREEIEDVIRDERGLPPHSFSGLKESPARVADWNTVSQFVLRYVDDSFLEEQEQRGRYAFLDPEDMGPRYAEQKQRLYDRVTEVIGEDDPQLEEKRAVIMAMAMQEDAGGDANFVGWDQGKDRWDAYRDGSINYSIFNMNRDFLNSIRADLHNDEVSVDGRSDPLGDQPLDWGMGSDAYFNGEGGWSNIDHAIEYLDAAFDFWGADNVMNTHRNGYDGGLRPADDVTRVYREGMRRQVQFLLDNPEHLTDSMRVAGDIPHLP